jgi:hypothetical protein
MNRRLLIVLLSLGTFVGYAHGFSSMSRRHHSRCHGGGWDQRWDSRGHRSSWDSPASRGAAPSVASPSPAPAAEAPASPAEPR